MPAHQARDTSPVCRRKATRSAVASMEISLSPHGRAITISSNHGARRFIPAPRFIWKQDVLSSSRRTGRRGSRRRAVRGEIELHGSSASWRNVSSLATNAAAPHRGARPSQRLAARRKRHAASISSAEKTRWASAFLGNTAEERRHRDGGRNAALQLSERKLAFSAVIVTSTSLRHVRCPMPCLERATTAAGTAKSSKSSASARVIAHHVERAHAEPGARLHMAADAKIASRAAQNDDRASRLHRARRERRSHGVGQPLPSPASVE